MAITITIKLLVTNFPNYELEKMQIKIIQLSFVIGGIYGRKIVIYKKRFWYGVMSMHE